MKAMREPSDADTIMESAAAGSHTRQYSICGVASLSASASVWSHDESDAAKATPMVKMLKYFFMEYYFSVLDV